MSFGHVKKKSVTLRIPRMREANNIMYKLVCEEQHMHKKRKRKEKTPLVVMTQPA